MNMVQEVASTFTPQPLPAKLSPFPLEDPNPLHLVDLGGSGKMKMGCNGLTLGKSMESDIRIKFLEESTSTPNPTLLPI